MARCGSWIWTPCRLPRLVLGSQVVGKLQQCGVQPAVGVVHCDRDVYRDPGAGRGRQPQNPSVVLRVGDSGERSA